MGKHSLEKEKNGKRIMPYIVLIITLCVLMIVAITLIKNRENSNKILSITQSTTIEGQKLVFKSTSAFNKIIEYTFEDNKLKTVKVYEQFENENDFKTLKEQYENIQDIKILKIDEKEKSIEIEKLDFGSDKDKSYEEIYDKYLVQIIGAYEQI